jgi:hypothetical protein
VTPESSRTCTGKRGRCRATRAALRQFARYLVKRGWVRANFDPMFRITKAAKEDIDPDRKWQRRSVPFEEWVSLLEAAGTF